MRKDDVDGGPVDDVHAVAVQGTTPVRPMGGNAAVLVHNARKANHHFMSGNNRAQKRAHWKHYKRHTTVTDVRIEIAQREATERAKVGK